MASLTDKLKALGVEAPIEWNTDKPTRNASQWFIGKEFLIGDETIQVAWFGDYKTGKKDEWRSEPGRALSDAEKAAVEKQLKETLAIEKAAREAAFEQTAELLRAQFEEYSTRGTTPYLQRKQISQLFGARIAPNEHGDPIIAVPMYDVVGKFWNYQRIYSQKLSAGDKFFGEAARIDGTFFTLGLREITGTGSAYLCEGFATAASVQMALPDETVVACFNAANLVHVAKAIHESYPKLKLYICGDNDAFTKINGELVNVGLKYARQACAHSDGTLLYPIFKDPRPGFTDFNDLHCAEGLDVVTDQLLNPGKHRTEVEPLSAKVTKSGKTEIPSEKKVADYLLTHFAGRLAKEQGNLFMYSNGFWSELQDGELDRLKQAINLAASDLLSARDVESYLRTLITYTPPVRQGGSFYTTNPFMANFGNGTLQLFRQEGKYKLTFAPHAPEDLATHILPFDFPGWEAISAPPPTPMFDALIKQLWGEHGDSDQKRRLVYQLLGAALMPAFPHIVIFVGPPKSGKSTLIKLISQMVSLKNLSNVQMADMKGFHMESMVGKLLNIDMDIDVNRPIQDSMVKKITDRFPFSVQRKNKTNVTSYLPALHLFAANSLPRSLDGSSKAYGRRMSIVRTSAGGIPEKYTLDYERRVWEQESVGIIAKAVQGLKDLVDTDGLYAIPDSSKAEVDSMEMESDFIGQFLDEISHGEVRDANTVLEVGKDKRVGRTVLWNVFSDWQDHSLPVKNHIGKNHFFAGLQERGFKLLAVKGERCFAGIGAHALSEDVGQGIG